MSILRWSQVFLLLLASACGGGGNQDSPPAGSSEILIFGTGANGIFDPSLAKNSGSTLWMTYSDVSLAPVSNKLLQIRTGLASSADNGASWTNHGVLTDIVPLPPVPDPMGGANWTAIFEQEVSRLEYDAADTDTGRRWKLLWHQYIYAYNPNSDSSLPLYQNGWIALKTAAMPGGLAAASSRKLFTGTWYNAAGNGPSEFPLATTVPTLNDCAVFTEPSLLAVSDGVYVALRCEPDPAIANSMGKIVLLKCTHTAQTAFASCSHLGNLLVDSEAADHGAYTGFSAPDLVHAGNKDYLLVTPTNNGYRGCLVFEIADLASASLVRDLGKAVIVKSLTDNHGGAHYGACGYHPAATASGILDSSADINWNPQFRIFSSKTHLP